MTPEDLRRRTFAFAKDVMQISQPMLGSLETRATALQLRDAASSVAANYRTVNRAKSHRDFTAKLATVLEEADEALHWLAFARDCGWLDPTAVAPLAQEAEELVKIFSRSVATARRHDAAARPRSAGRSPVRNN
jgi:four helix bundle protein